MQNKQRTDPNAVTATLRYYPGRRSAAGTISFRSARRDINVLEAQAEMVDGVRIATAGLNRPGQELDITITEYHARTPEMAKQVIAVILRRLRLTAIGGILVVDESEPKKGKGKKKRK